MFKKIIFLLLIFIVSFIAGFFMAKNYFSVNNTNKNLQNNSPQNLNNKINLPTEKDVLNNYDGRKLSFNNNCVANVNKITIENKTSVFFENRGDKLITIHINNRSFSIEPKKYKSTLIFGDNVPSTIIIGCNTNKNVAQINLK